MEWEDILGDRSHQTIPLLIVIRESIMENGEITRSMGSVLTPGQMEESTKGNGGITSCMALACTAGMMGNCSWESINMAKKMAMEYINSNQVSFIWATGEAERRMA